MVSCPSAPWQPRPKSPHRLARPRTSALQADNAGSNPAGDTTSSLLLSYSPTLRLFGSPVHRFTDSPFCHALLVPGSPHLWLPSSSPSNRWALAVHPNSESRPTGSILHFSLGELARLGYIPVMATEPPLLERIAALARSGRYRLRLHAIQHMLPLIPQRPWWITPSKRGQRG